MKLFNDYIQERLKKDGQSYHKSVTAEFLDDLAKKSEEQDKRLDALEKRVWDLPNDVVLNNPKQK